ncbi:MAG: hypothetical protein HYZ29_08490 [Myxococcales bacterium]|nr:hypothetical protein [Myxococcales bacterium]
MRLLVCSALLGAAGCMTVFPVSATGKGCEGESADYYPARDVVRRRAARELDCSGPITLTALSDTRLTASGCGQSLTYECEADAVSGCSLDDASEREGCQALEL